MPLAYRDTVASAILEWNKAFERIGFRDAIVVEQQPDDAAFDTLDAGCAAVRWMMSADPSFAAIGPSHVDPRSGEILDAVIAFEGMETRVRRTERRRCSAGPPVRSRIRRRTAARLPAPPTRRPAESAEHCLFGDLAAEQLGYGMDILAPATTSTPAAPRRSSTCSTT